MLINNPETRGRRVRSARMLAGLSRKTIHHKYKIHANTLKLWENPLHSRRGLTEKGAQRLIDALLKEGVLCTIEWLMAGTNPGPSLIGTQQILKNKAVEKASSIKLSKEALLLKELEAFKNVHPTARVFMVTDDGMEPQYHYGDYVGGYKKFGKEILKYIKLNCIIKTNKGEIYFRRFIPQNNGYYDLYCTNPHTNVSSPIIKNIKILWAAPVVWHRIKEDH